MSDFINNNWSVFITGVTVLGILAGLLLLIVTGRKKVAAQADNTTGHVWDGDLREMNNPLPRWWVWVFYATIVWGIGYSVAYPAWPMLTEATPGLLGASTRADVAVEIAAVDAANAAIKAKLVAADLNVPLGDGTVADLIDRAFPVVDLRMESL